LIEAIDKEIRFEVVHTFHWESGLHIYTKQSLCQVLLFYNNIIHHYVSKDLLTKTMKFMTSGFAKATLQ